jgi:hypothetical protein
MRRAPHLAAALAFAAFGGGTCSHANRPCPTTRVFVGRPTTHAPDDPATAARIAATGARYEVCSQAANYVIERPGARTLTDDELFELAEAFEKETPSLEVGIGASGCPSLRPLAKPHPKGWVTHVDENTVTPVDVAERLAALAARAGGDPAMRIRVSIQSAPGPRCAADDPACGPLPYDAACVEQTSYDPKAKRTVFLPGPRAGACSHDGECTPGGCGNSCVSTAFVPRPGPCVRYGWKDIYCGCVEKTCAWFTTK